MDLPSGDARSRLLHATFVVLVAAVLFLPPVGQRLIPTSHEARFAIIAGDMLERGVWFDAEVRRHPYRNKPPLHPWTIVACSWLPGRVTEASAQLASALASIGIVLGTFLLGDRLFGLRAGLWAGLIVATSYGVFAHSQMILPDMLMIALGLVAGWFFWRAIAEPARPAAMVGFYVMLALGVFTKGPPGLLPLAVAVVWLLMQEGPAGLRRLWSPWGALAFVALSLVWLTPFLTLGRGDFVGHAVWTDWVYYYLRAPRARAFGSQIAGLLGGFLPWTLLAPLAVVHAARTFASPAVRFAVLWFAVQFVLIMLSTNQRLRYLLSLYPGVALLVAWWAVGTPEDGRRLRRALSLVTLALGLGAALALALGLVPGVVVPGLSWAVGLTVAGTLVAWLALAGGLWSGRRGVLLPVVTAGMVVALVAGVRIHNAQINADQGFKALAGTIERHAAGGEVGVYVSKGEYLQIDFYMGRDLAPLTALWRFHAYLARPGRPLVVLNQEIWERHRERMVDVEVLDTSVVGGEEMRLVRRRR